MKTPRLAKLLLAVAAPMALCGASNVEAQTYTLDVSSVPGSVFHNVTTTDTGNWSLGSFIGNFSNNGGPEGEKSAWAQFDIPVYPGKAIFAAVLSTHVVDNRGVSAPGAVAVYSSDDSWNLYNPPLDFPTQAGPSASATIATIGNFLPGNYKTDITSFLSLPGEGQGHALTVRINGYGGGIRGAYLGDDPIIFPGSAAAVRLTLTTTDAALAGLSRGRALLLQRGLQIQGLAFRASGPLNQSRWAASNFTTLNVWDNATMPTLSEAPAGTAWARVDSDNEYQIPSNPNYAQNLVSMQYGDEQPLTTDFVNTAAAKFASWRVNYPNTLAYANHFPAQVSPASLANYMQVAQPDMLMFDYYPSYSFPENDRSSWYSAMQMYRTAGLAGNDGTGAKPIPYAQFLNLFRSSYSAPTPSESYVRLQQNASWAFGYSAVSAFVYNNPYVQGSLVPVMFSSDGDGSPNSVFGYVAEANRQSLHLGPALVRLVNTGIRMIKGTSFSALPGGVSSWTPHAGSTTGYTDYLTSITPYTNSTAHGGTTDTSYSDVVVGYFKPLLDSNPGFTFADGLHFMIVNGAATGTAAASEQWYHLTFDFTGSDFDALARLSRDSGQVESVSLMHLSGSLYYLDLYLPGGTGDLFAYWDSSTPLPTIPEPSALGLVTALLTVIRSGRSRRSKTKLANSRS